MLGSISVAELKKISNDVNIIDVRNISNYNNGHIANALNIPYQELITNPKKHLDFNNTYYIYCQQGITSIKVCNYLKKLGFKVINVDGGYEEWVLEN